MYITSPIAKKIICFRTFRFRNEPNFYQIRVMPPNLARAYVPVLLRGEVLLETQPVAPPRPDRGAVPPRSMRSSEIIV